MKEMNKTLEVAKLLGQPINKIFTVKYCNEKFDCKFYSAYGKYGFIVFDKPAFAAFLTEQIFYALLMGEAKIVEY